MMNQQKTKKAGILKYSLIVPLALALVLSSNAETLVNKTKNVISQKEVTSDELAGSAKTDLSSTVYDSNSNEAIIAQTTADSLHQNSKQLIGKSDKDQIYTVVEKMPQYPGGEQALINYISQNMKYPKEAMEKGGQGTIIIRFTVNSKGKVVDPIFLKSTVSEDNKEVGSSNLKVVELLDHEALRVINSFPDFIPGEQNGKKVSVYYTLPIVFRLDDSSGSSSQGKSSIVGVDYGDKNYPNSGTAPKVKEFDPNNPPIYIIDGKEVLESEFKVLKPENIKEISVLKDASATAIYGDKGKNGVILITMKKWNQINAVTK